MYIEIFEFLITFYLFLDDSCEPQLNLLNDSLKEPRKILKAKRKIESLNEIKAVIDTNVLLNDFINFKDLILNTDSIIHSSYSLHFIIPWTVINELDGLKNSSETKRNATRAIRFINEWLKSDQNKITCSKKVEKEPFLNNDDQILEFCLSLVQDAFLKVVLITNDINLQNKSLINKIESYTLQEFICAYSEKDIKKEKRKMKILIKSSDLKSQENKKLNESSSLNSLLKRFKSDKTSSNITDIKADLPKVTKMTNLPVSKYSHVKNILEKKLKEFIFKRFKLTYGDEMWQNILNKNYQNGNTNLLESLRVIKKNWIPVFSQCFKPDFYNLIEKMILSTLERTNCKNLEVILRRIN